MLYGCNPDLVHARRSRLTYGIKACVPLDDPDAPGRFWNEEEACFYTDRLFHVFVEKGQLVRGSHSGSTE